MSRRTLLGTAWLAPLAGSMEHLSFLSLPADLKFALVDSKLRLVGKRRVYWELDTTQWGGAMNITLTDDELKICGLHYPGTDITSDVTLRIFQKSATWMIVAEFSRLGRSKEAKLSDWLHDISFLRLGIKELTIFSNSAGVAFWSGREGVSIGRRLDIHATKGDGRVSLTGIIEAGFAGFSLEPNLSEKEFTGSRSKRGSQLRLAQASVSGELIWSGKGWHLNSGLNEVDVDFELSETIRGKKMSAVRLTPTQPSKATLEILGSSKMKPIAISLENPTLFGAVEGSTREMRFVSDISNESITLETELGEFDLTSIGAQPASLTWVDGHLRDSQVALIATHSRIRLPDAQTGRTVLPSRMQVNLLGSVSSNASGSRIEHNSNLGGNHLHLQGSFVVNLLRFDNLMNLNVRLEGFTVQGTTQKTLSNSQNSALVGIQFPPQHREEQNFPVGTIPSVAGQIRWSDRSEIWYEIPQGSLQIPLTAKGLFAAIQTLTPRYSKKAISRTPNNQDITELSNELNGATDPFPQPESFSILRPDKVTNLEIPTGLILSPTKGQVFKFDGAPEHLGEAVPVGYAPGTILSAASQKLKEPWTPLWQARLAQSANSSDPLTARVIGIRKDGALSVSTPITPDQKCAIAWQMSAFPLPMSGNAPDTQGTRNDWIRQRAQEAINVSHLNLTPLGAWFSGVYARKLQSLHIVGWHHSMAGGMDNEVIVIEDGYLYPYGHRATYTRRSQRKFAGGADNKLICYLELTEFITILDRTRTYRDSRVSYGTGSTYVGREFPFDSVDADSHPSPAINTTDINVGGTVVGKTVQLNGKSYRFPFSGFSGNRSSNFSAPCIWISSILFDGSHNAILDPAMDQIRNAFAQLIVAENDSEIWASTDGVGAAVDLPMVALDGQEVTFAKLGPQESDKHSTLKAVSIAVGTVAETFTADSIIEIRKGRIPFLPRMEAAIVRVPALEHLPGASEVGIVYDDTYVKAGWDVVQNPGKYFAKGRDIASAAVDMAAATVASESGALTNNVTLAVVGLSSTTGALMASAKQQAGAVAATADQLMDRARKEAKFDGNLLKTLLGDIRLLGLFSLSDIFANIAIPKDRLPAAKPIKVGNQVGVEYSWSTDVPDYQVLKKTGSSPIRLDILSEAMIDLTTRRSSSRVEGNLTGFTLTTPFLNIAFSSLKFVRNPDGSTHLTPVISGIDFTGALETFATLASQFGGMGDKPFKLSFEASHLNIDYVFPIPHLSFGAFSILDLNLRFGVGLPMASNLALLIRFALAERSRPFIVSVAPFGGTGFFELHVPIPKGKIEVQIQLEFGAYVGIDLAVVKGAVYIFAGIYVSLNGPDGLIIEMHIRAGGYVNAFGIITMGIEGYAGLTYYANRKLLAGVLTFTVYVKILFFSASATFSVQKEFSVAGLPGSEIFAMDGEMSPEPLPYRSFADTISSPEWNSYWRTFDASDLWGSL